MRVLIAGGGTGGHFYPAMSVIEELRAWKPDVKVGYVGTRSGIEARVLPSHPSVRFFPIHAVGLAGARSLHRLRAWILLLYSFLESLLILARFRPEIVIGVGGYSSFPPVFLAALLGRFLRIRTLIHEQNAIPGLANRRLAGYVDGVLLAYPEARRHFAHARRVAVTGNPVRRELLLARRSDAAYRMFGLDPSRRTVLVFGGSLGSSQLVDSILAAKESLARTDSLQVLLVTGGAADEERIRSELHDAGVRNVVVRHYIDRMGEAFAVADLVVSRAGATTLAEITACGKASLVVPWSGAADNHQWENARALRSIEGCTLVDERDIVSRGLVHVIQDLVADEEALALLARNAWRSGRRNARALILGEIKGLMRGAGA